MQVLYPLMYLIYSLKMYSMYWTDLFERYVENGRQNVCGHYSQKVPSLSLPSSPRWWYVCWEWVLVGGQNVGLGTQPTTPKKTDSSSCSDQTSPPLPIVHSLCHCRPAICVFALGYLYFMFVCVCMFSRSNQSYPSLPICSFSMDKDSVRGVLFFLLSDLEN